VIRSLLLVLLLAAPAVRAQDPDSGAPVLPHPSNGAEADSSGVVIPDSLGGRVLMPVFEVRGTILRPQPQADVQEISPGDLQSRETSSVADIAPLVPSTRAATNSRGETVLMVRGAPERQIVIHQDGVPLTLPWDERADLSLLPTAAVGEVRVVRGAGSVLSGPNAMAAFVDLRTRVREMDGVEGSLRLSLGEVDRRKATGRVLWRDGAWSGLAVVDHDEREGFLLSEDARLDYHQDPDRRTRTNSDQERSAGLLKVAREFDGGSRLALSLQGYRAEKGVPPEGHIPDARFWRYPEIERAILGLDLDLRPGGGERWQVDVNASIDRFHQEIRAYDDAAYAGPARGPGADYETDDDRTGYGRLEIRRRLDEKDTLALASSARYTLHTESLVVDGPEQDYSEWLGGVAVEWERRDVGRWGLRLGAGVDYATTPKTGDKPARDAQTAPTLSARVTREIRDRGEAYLQVARRSRFPSLRELYSGALGRFEPNLDLRPEDQTSLELGGSVHGGRWSLSAAAFGYLTEDGIVRVSLPDRRFQRVNQDEIRVLGLELMGVWRPRPGLKLEGHHSLLHARARDEGGDFDQRVEDRPAFLSRVDLSQRFRFGGRIGVEAVAVGPRWSQDLDAQGLTEIPAQIAWNLRVAYELNLVSPWLRSAEAFARVENVLDAPLLAQIGLPEPGRQLLVGVEARLGR
jgi:iron complex outermembrane receptor protein